MGFGQLTGRLPAFVLTAVLGSACAAEVPRASAAPASTSPSAAAASVSNPDPRPTDSAQASPGPPSPGASSSSAPLAAVRVIAGYAHDPAAFTQGLVVHDGALYESTGLYGESSLRQVALETGEVLGRVDLAEQYFAEGLALLDDRLYQLTWREQTGFVYAVEGFTENGTFSYEGEGWGLTTDGTALIMSDGSAVLRYLDPESFAVAGTLEVTDGALAIDRLNELEWVRGEIWANVLPSDRIARIDPRTGAVTGWLDLSGLLDDPAFGPAGVANGIAYDPATDRIFVTGKRWPLLFEIEVMHDG